MVYCDAEWPNTRTGSRLLPCFHRMLPSSGGTFACPSVVIAATDEFFQHHAYSHPPMPGPISGALEQHELTRSLPRQDCTDGELIGPDVVFLRIAEDDLDSNALLADLIEAKRAVRDCQTLYSDYCRVLRDVDVAGLGFRPRARLPWPPTLVEPGVGGRWLYSKQTFQLILSISDAIANVESDLHRRLLNALLCSVLVKVSNVTKGPKGRRYRANWRSNQKGPADVFIAFQQALNEAVFDMLSRSKVTEHESHHVVD
jgi:hypothetical protein